VTDDERAAEHLPDEAFVVRGGIMESDRLLLNAKDVHEDEDVGEWGVCAASCPGMSPTEIAEEADFQNKQMMTTSVGSLRNRGFDVVPDPEEGPVHVLIMLPVATSEEPSEEEWEEVWDELRGCFDDAVPNPARR
jgi:hypothetical protein